MSCCCCSKKQLQKLQYDKIEKKSKKKKKVTFKNDSENLMTPPCEVKLYNKDDSPSQINKPFNFSLIAQRIK